MNGRTSQRGGTGFQQHWPARDTQRSLVPVFLTIAQVVGVFWQILMVPNLRQRGVYIQIVVQHEQHGFGVAPARTVWQEPAEQEQWNTQ